MPASKHRSLNMTFSQIERVVRLHGNAYGILLWLKRAARERPELLSQDEAERLENGDDCVAWVKRHLITTD